MWGKTSVHRRRAVSALIVFSCAAVAASAAGAPARVAPAAQEAEPVAPPAAAPSAPPAAPPPGFVSPEAAPTAPPPAFAPAEPVSMSVEEAPVAVAEPTETTIQEPEPVDLQGPFARGRVRVSAVIGTGSTGSDTYLILGAGAGYYVLDNVELGLDYELWAFGDPTLQRLSPGLRYVIDLKAVKPYVGAFYRHTFVSDDEDFDQVGARAGLYLTPGRAFIGAGVVYERLLNCDDSSLYDCDSVYPEVSIGVSF